VDDAAGVVVAAGVVEGVEPKTNVGAASFFSAAGAAAGVAAGAGVTEPPNTKVGAASAFGVVVSSVFFFSSAAAGAGVSEKLGAALTTGVGAVKLPKAKPGAASVFGLSSLSFAAVAGAVAGAGVDPKVNPPVPNETAGAAGSDVVSFSAGLGFSGSSIGLNAVTAEKPKVAGVVVVSVFLSFSAAGVVPKPVNEIGVKVGADSVFSF